MFGVRRRLDNGDNDDNPDSEMMMNSHDVTGTLLPMMRASMATTHRNHPSQRGTRRCCYKLPRRWQSPRHTGNIITSTSNINNHTKKSMHHRLGILTSRVLRSGLTIWTIYFITKTILYIVPRIEKPLQPYPYWRALVFNPLRYVRVKYWDDERPHGYRNFTMTWSNSYFVNLDRDTNRLAKFRQTNPISYHNDNATESFSSSLPLIQRVSAHEWVAANSLQSEHEEGGGTTTTTTPNDNNARERQQQEAERSRLLQIQEKWLPRYPFLGLSVKRNHLGDAGCSLSHLLLWEERLLRRVASHQIGMVQTSTGSRTSTSRDQEDYLFVFEDDAKLLEPLRSHPHTIQAPDNADIVLLTATALKPVPWEPSPLQQQQRTTRPHGQGALEPFASTPTTKEDEEEELAVRVLGGFGTFGYIITRQGALKMLDHFQTSHRPVDLSFFEAASVRVYLPKHVQWPAVKHDGRKQAVSSRVSLNNNSSKV